MSYTFINPYNFVPLGKEKTVVKKDDSADLLSGVIEYSLLTKTPLFIPNTSNDHAILPELYNQATEKEQQDGEYHKSYEFYSYADLNDQIGDELSEPVIPGSEMRGMLRSNFEILTNSCMSSIEDVRVSKRTSAVFAAGLIKRCTDGSNVTYELYQAEDCLLRTNIGNSQKVNWEKTYKRKDLKEGQLIYVTLVDHSKRPRGKSLIEAVSEKYIDDYVPGYVIKGEDGPDVGVEKTKHCAHVFLPPENMSMVSSNINIKDLVSVLDEYKANNADSYKEYASRLAEFKTGSLKQEYFPVYYSIIKCNGERRIYLSPASITRERYHNSLTDVLKTYSPCRDKDSLCPACELFGTVNTQSGISKASRVRITDLSVMKDQKDWYSDPTTLDELSSPKLSSTEFYLKQPDKATFWTYDYYVKKGMVYLYTPELNGRKFYWHDMSCMAKRLPKMINPNQMKDEEKKALKRRYSCRPVKEGIKFSGKVYFDGVTKAELNRLIYVLNVGDSPEDSLEEKKHGYKLGGGKPLGLGSISLKVDSVKVRNLEVNEDLRTVEYSEKEYNSYSEPILEQKDDFLTMTDFVAISESDNVGYPRTKANGNIFDWFTGNHGDGMKANKREKMVFKEHMVSLTPSLKKNDSVQETMPADSTSGRKEYNKGKNIDYPRGTCKTAKITRVSSNSIGLEFDDGKKGYVHTNGEKYQLNTSVKIYVGKYDEEHGNYKCTIKKK